MVRRRKWPVVAKLLWCQGCNVPLLGEVCSRCEQRGVQIKLCEPGDARPAFEHDVKLLEETMFNEFKSSKPFNCLLRDKLVLLNKAAYLDDMKEVVCDGNVVGKLYFDPRVMAWRFKLDYFGAVKLIGEGLLDCVSVDRKVRRREVIKRSRANLGEEVAIAREGRLVGLGRNMEGGVVVERVFEGAHLNYASGKPASLADALKANEWRLYVLRSRAIKFLNVMAEKVGKPIVLSFSGGKDSAVCLDLAEEALGDFLVLFNDTGIEMPETLDNVEDLVRAGGFKLVEANAGGSFWRDVEFFGPPARDYRWCCKVCKLIPIAKAVKSEWPSGALSIVGQRAFESLERAASQRVWRNVWIPTLLSISPIQDWSALAVWLHIFDRGLKVNALYYRGFDRVGCFMCPASRLAEFKEVERQRGDLWLGWESFLRRWAAKVGLPSEWVTYGLWRWLTDAPAKVALAKYVGVRLPEWSGIYSRWGEVTLSCVYFDGSCVEGRLSGRVDLDALYQQRSIMACRGHKSDGRVLLKDGGEYSMSLDGSFKVAGGAELLERAADLLKLAIRGAYCLKCASCELWCPKGAIKATPLMSVKGEVCVGCKVCIDECPISDQFVEKLIMPLLLCEQLAWRRGSRRPKEALKELGRRAGQLNSVQF